jgi:N-acetyl-anhydromuramyl-L-alanine amidase AmpD
MDIITNTAIRNKYTQGFPRTKEDVSEITIHCTAGGRQIEDLTNWMEISNSKNYYEGIGLFHYAIGQDGRVVNIIDPETRWCWHSTSGRHDKTTIGIECLNPSSSNAEPLTAAQYSSLMSLIFGHIIGELKFNIKTILGHDATARKYSGLKQAHEGVQCPGPAFDWTNLESVLFTMYPNYKKLADANYSLV